MDDWKQTWDWAREVWGEDTDEPLFHWFFGGVARVIAEREDWDEIGSSDVWHASFHCVKRAKEDGSVTDRASLRQYVMDYQGIGEWELRC